ncbi:PRKR-interacting protein 1 homolog [Oppia nitens]|uniref:PRKR-interacting protein 1 homolog n=1 Tax=Oppia nitens TaxID=1686743 RepID=UPI0023DAA80D|nr:PRKR-interacting protein 1 homolog [Oppia nitens]
MLFTFNNNNNHNNSGHKSSDQFLKELTITMADKDNKDKDTKDDGNKPTKFKNYTLYDIQKIRLEKLMKNPDKPVDIPERHKEKKFAEPPDFVRNIMGSSAGAGSGEFHVYRHLRRKEYARMRHIENTAKHEEMDNKYYKRVEDNKKKAEEKTAKKREKRQKRKQKLKNKRLKKADKQDKSDKSDDNGSNSDGDDDDNDDEEEQKDQTVDQTKDE